MFPNFGIFQIFGEDQTDFEIYVIVEVKVVLAYFHGLVKDPNKFM